jgi:hypothetical protein
MMMKTTAQRHRGAAIIYLVGIDSTKKETNIFYFLKKHVKHTR